MIAPVAGGYEGPVMETEETVKYSLIIVDDELKIREGLQNLFPWNNYGYEIKGTFANGRQALDFLEKSKADVVLTDICMPLMDGIELNRQINIKYPDTLVVYLTGYSDFKYMQAAIRNHAADYLLKPIRHDDLYTCLEKIHQKLDKKYHIRPGNETDSAYYGKIIVEVVHYLEENYRTATLTEAASRVNMSPNYLSRIFREKSETGFSELLTQIRMKKAAELLCDISYKAYEIAYLVGYDNPKNFSRAFKQYYSVSPKEFRNQNERADEK